MSVESTDPVVGAARLPENTDQIRRWRSPLVALALALIGLLPYALYQLRHYLRVRQYVQQIHYRVGLHSFHMVCGTVVTGLALLLPLAADDTT